MNAPKVHPVVAALQELLPDGIEVVGHAETFATLALEAERRVTGKMVPSRRDEFLTGRSCARAALRRFGLPDTALLPGADRAPQWPPGVVGSISHTRGFCVAAVGAAEQFFSVGIDVERRRGVGDELENYVATPKEAARLRDVDDWRTLAFSIKESVFKSLNPVTGIWLEFHDVELLEMEGATFVAEVSPALYEPFRLTGGFTRLQDFVVSAVAHVERPMLLPR